MTGSTLQESEPRLDAAVGLQIVLQRDLQSTSTGAHVAGGVLHALPGTVFESHRMFGSVCQGRIQGRVILVGAAVTQWRAPSVWATEPRERDQSS